MKETGGANPILRRDVQKWLALGLLIRLFFMPLTVHGDLLSVYRRAYLLLEGRAGWDLILNIPNLFHAGYLWTIRPLIPYQALWGGVTGSMLADAETLRFINSASIFRTLFLLKLPYLFFEILAVWLLLYLVEPERAGRVTAFWMLNPVVIFATYIFGRYDIVIVFLILGALLLARNERPNLSMLVLSAAALTRIYPIILVLPFAFTLEKDWPGRARLTAVGILPLGASVLIGGFVQRSGIVSDLTTMSHLGYPLAMKFSLGKQDNLYIFILIYSLIIMYLYINPRLGFDNLKRFCFYVMLTFFATSFFHPHYLMWLVPFAAFYFDTPKFLPLYGVQIGSWVIYTWQWGRALAGHLISPISPAFFWSINSPSEWIQRFYPPEQFIGLGRSVFTATCLALAYIVWRSVSETQRPATAGSAEISGEIAPKEGG